MYYILRLKNGGKGSRISEETFDKPKPLIKICDKPILLHIIDIYKYNEFERTTTEKSLF